MGGGVGGRVGVGGKGGNMVDVVECTPHVFIGTTLPNIGLSSIETYIRSMFLNSIWVTTTYNIRCSQCL